MLDIQLITYFWCIETPFFCDDLGMVYPWVYHMVLYTVLPMMIVPTDEHIFRGFETTKYS